MLCMVLFFFFFLGGGGGVTDVEVRECTTLAGSDMQPGLGSGLVGCRAIGVLADPAGVLDGFGGGKPPPPLPYTPKRDGEGGGPPPTPTP